ncbi:hypothetical protein [Mollivirus kamchatka]|nr:hypothetical protein [Mollivirus kamchatka]
MCTTSIKDPRCFLILSSLQLANKVNKFWMLFCGLLPLLTKQFAFSAQLLDLPHHCPLLLDKLLMLFPMSPDPLQELLVLAFERIRLVDELLLLDLLFLFYELCLCLEHDVPLEGRWIIWTRTLPRYRCWLPMLLHGTICLRRLFLYTSEKFSFEIPHMRHSLAIKRVHPCPCPHCTLDHAMASIGAKTTKCRECLREKNRSVVDDTCGLKTTDKERVYEPRAKSEYHWCDDDTLAKLIVLANKRLVSFEYKKEK